MKPFDECEPNSSVFVKKSGEIKLKGWVYRKREISGNVFIVLRDSTDVVQTVISKDNVSDDEWNDVLNADVEASVFLEGSIRKEDRAPGGFEVSVEKFKLIGESHAFPITKDFSEAFLSDMRHLWIRSRKITSVLKIRSMVFQAIREYFISEGFFESHSPIIISTQTEGGSTLFDVNYFNHKLHLTQTWQLHAEAIIFALEKIFTISPTFRAEKSKTNRHLAEFWMAEMEVAWADFDDIIKYGEGLVKHILKRVLENNQKELKILKRDVSKLTPTLEKPFIRMTYDEALKVLKEKCDFDVKWGKDLRTIEEEKLTKLYDVPVIVTEYPKVIKAFYMKEAPDNKDVVLGCDFLAPEGIGEIIGGSQREEDPVRIRERLIEMGENPDEYGFYMDTRTYGSVPHSGFGLGVERVIRWICGLDSIRDAIAFPRTMQRYYP